MTKDEIIRMAREAGMAVTAPSWGYTDTYHFAGYEDKLERFAALVAAAEREACAKVCDDIDVEYEGEDVLATWCSAAIRAKGNK